MEGSLRLVGGRNRSVLQRSANVSANQEGIADLLSFLSNGPRASVRIPVGRAASCFWHQLCMEGEVA